MLDGRCTGHELRGASSSPCVLWPRFTLRHNSRRPLTSPSNQHSDETRASSGRLASSSVSCSCSNAGTSHVVTCPTERTQAESLAPWRTIHGQHTSSRDPQLSSQQQRPRQQQRETPARGATAGPSHPGTRQLPPQVRAVAGGSESGASVSTAVTYGAPADGYSAAESSFPPPPAQQPPSQPSQRQTVQSQQSQHQQRERGRQQQQQPSGLGGRVGPGRCFPDAPLLTSLIGGCSSWRALSALVEQYGSGMNAVHVTAVVTRLARVPPPPRLRWRQQQAPAGGSSDEVREWGSFLRSALALVEAQARALDARGIANISWALADLLSPLTPQHQQQDSRLQVPTAGTTELPGERSAGWSSSGSSNHSRDYERNGNGNGGGGEAGLTGKDASSRHQQQQQRQEQLIVEDLRITARRTVCRLLSLPAADPHMARPGSGTGGGAMTPRHVANALWAAASLRILSVHVYDTNEQGTGADGSRVEGARGWIGRAMAAARGMLRSGAFSEEGLSQLVWSISELGLAPDAAWMADLYGALRRQAPELSMHSAANVLLSLGRMASAAAAASSSGGTDGGFVDDDDDDGGDDEFGAARQASEYVGSSSSVSNSLGGAAAACPAATFHPPSDSWLFGFLADTSAILGSADAVALANSVWGLAVLLQTRTTRQAITAAAAAAGSAVEHLHEAPSPPSLPPPSCWLRRLYEALLQPGALAGCNDGQLGRVLWSLAAISDARPGGLPTEPPEELLAAAAASLRGRMAAMSDKSFAMASWGLQRLQMRLQQRQQLRQLRTVEQQLRGLSDEARRSGGDVAGSGSSSSLYDSRAWQAAWLRSAARRMPYMTDRWLLLSLQAVAGWAPAGADECWFASATGAVLRPGRDEVYPFVWDSLDQPGPGSIPRSSGSGAAGSSTADRTTADNAPDLAATVGVLPPRRRLPALLQALVLAAEVCLPQDCLGLHLVLGSVAEVVTEAAMLAPGAATAASTAAEQAEATALIGQRVAINGQGDVRGYGEGRRWVGVWSATELLRCTAALARAGYIPTPAWRKAFFGRVLQLAALPSPSSPPLPPLQLQQDGSGAETAEVGTAGSTSAARVRQSVEQRQQRRQRHRLSPSDVALLLSCSQRWAATASDATLAALLYGVPYEVWTPRAAAWVCRLLALQAVSAPQAQQPPAASPQVLPASQQRLHQDQDLQELDLDLDRQQRLPPQAERRALASNGIPGMIPAGATANPARRDAEAVAVAVAVAADEKESPPQPCSATAVPRQGQRAAGPGPPPVALRRSAAAAEAAATRGSLSFSDVDADLGLGLELELDARLSTGGGAGSCDVLRPGGDELVLVPPPPRLPPSGAVPPAVAAAAARPSPAVAAAATAAAAASSAAEGQGAPLWAGAGCETGNGRWVASAVGGGGVVTADAEAAAAALPLRAPGTDGSGARREEVLQRGPGRPAAGAPLAESPYSQPASARGSAAVAAVAAASAASGPPAVPRPSWSPSAAAAAVSYINTWPGDSVDGSDGEATASAPPSPGSTSDSVDGRGATNGAALGYTAASLAATAAAGSYSGQRASRVVGGVPGLLQSTPGPDPGGWQGPSSSIPVAPVYLRREQPDGAVGRASAAGARAPLTPPQRFVALMLGAACTSLARELSFRLESLPPHPKGPQSRAREASGAGAVAPESTSAAAAPSPPAPPASLAHAALAGRWSRLSLAHLLWSAARLGLRTSAAQRDVLHAALEASLLRWSATPPYTLVPLLWSCRRLGVRLSPGPAALLRRALQLHPGLQPSALSDQALFMLLEVLVAWRLDPPLEWSRQVPRRLTLWLLRSCPGAAAAAAKARGSTFSARKRAAGSGGAGGAGGVEARLLLVVLRALRRLQMSARHAAAAAACDVAGGGGRTVPGAKYAVADRRRMTSGLRLGAIDGRPVTFRLKLPPRWSPSWAPVPPAKAAAAVAVPPRRPRHPPGDQPSPPPPPLPPFVSAFDEVLWPELWPTLRSAVRRRLAVVFNLGAAAGAAAAGAAVTASSLPPLPPPAAAAASSPRERLAALMCGAACGLVDWEAWGLAALRRLAGELPPRDYHAWLALAVGLQHRVTRGSLEDLLLAWFISSGPHLDTMSPKQLHTTLRLTGRVAETLRRPLSWDWVSVALRRYSRCIPALPPAMLAQVPMVLYRLRRVPPPRWQASYADLVVRHALPYMSGRNAQAMLRGAAALSPPLAAALRGPVHEHMMAVWSQQQSLGRLWRRRAAQRRAEYERRVRVRRGVAVVRKRSSSP